MHGSRSANAALIAELELRLKPEWPIDVAIFPPFVYLSDTVRMLDEAPIAVGAQDVCAEAAGAFTGEVCAAMLKDAGCAYVILGHSERRHGHGESDAIVRAKVAAAWHVGLVAIVCVGETRAQREAGHQVAVVAEQIAGSLPDGATPDTLVIAYEPVWAIGTGLVPTLADINAVHHSIRSVLPQDTRILYGGSANPKNAREILSLDEVDGALVGGASLKAEDFWAIAEACR